MGGGCPPLLSLQHSRDGWRAERTPHYQCSMIVGGTAGTGTVMKKWKSDSRSGGSLQEVVKVVDQIRP